MRYDEGMTQGRMTKTKPGGRAGGEKRGNSVDRRRSRANLLARHGDGFSCPCSWCGAELLEAPGTPAHIERDKVDTWGSYTLGNLIPACRRCNLERSDQTFSDYLASCRRPDMAVAARRLAEG